MEIAKGVQDTDYLNLDLSDKTNPDWDTAFEYLQRRLNERFIEPADKLIEAENHLPAMDKKFGFAVLAIDCLLCETIQSFYEGIPDSTGQSTRLFTTFLQDRDSFKPYFPDYDQAKAFYKNFRCGILHQAQTSPDTKIWATGDLIMRRDRFVIVNRSLFHDKVKEELDKYINKLHLKDDPALMNFFKNKMDFIAGK